MKQRGFAKVKSMLKFNFKMMLNRVWREKQFYSEFMILKKL